MGRFINRAGIIVQNCTFSIDSFKKFNLKQNRFLLNCFNFYTYNGITVTHSYEKSVCNCQKSKKKYTWKLTIIKINI